MELLSRKFAYSDKTVSPRSSCRPTQYSNDCGQSGVTGAPVSIASLGRAVSGSAFIKHKIKRMNRLAGNSHLKSEREQ